MVTVNDPKTMRTSIEVMVMELGRRKKKLFMSFLQL